MALPDCTHTSWLANGTGARTAGTCWRHRSGRLWRSYSAKCPQNCAARPTRPRGWHCWRWSNHGYGTNCIAASTSSSRFLYAQVGSIHTSFIDRNVTWARLEQGGFVLDIVYVLATIGFFALMIAYVHACERLDAQASEGE